MYYFECFYCNQQTAIDINDLEDPHRNCEDCGEDMCSACWSIEKPRCDRCEKDLVDNI